MGMGWQVDAGVVSVYQTKNGSLSPRFSKTRVIPMFFSYSAYPPVFLTLVRLVHLVPHLLCHLFAAHYTLPHVFYLAPSLAAAGMHPHPSAFVAFGFQLRRFQGVTIITKKWYDEQIALLASGAAD